MGVLLLIVMSSNSGCNEMDAVVGVHREMVANRIKRSSTVHSLIDRR